MDAGVPATWIIAIACTTLTAVATAVVIAFAAYKVGRFTEKLKHKSATRERPMPPLYDPGRKSEEKKEPKTKKVEDDDWEWPIYDLHYSRTTHKMERKLRSKEKIKPTDAPFEVSYEQRRSRPAIVTVKLLSKPLIDIARRALTKHCELLTVQEPEIDAKHLFIALSSLKNETDRSQGPLKHLIRFLETEYKDVIVHMARMAREKTVTWGLLWAFLHKGEKVTYTCAKTGQTLQGVVQYVHYCESESRGNHMTCFLDCYDWNGVRYSKGRTSFKIEEFQNERSFEAIGICPIALLDAPEEMEAMLLRNGRKFYNIVSDGSCYMDYEGSIHQMVRGRTHSCWQLQKKQADGRVMVDLRSFARMCPGYPLQNAEPPSATSPAQSLVVTETPTDEELMLAPAIVYGFSFSTKLWGAFDVNGFSEIAFDDQAFDNDLVLTDPMSKEMMLALVSQYVQNDVPKLDPISKKGDGCVFLCYGPPGTGKTLTAESIAEKLHRPLWSISVCELGTNENQLETNLMQILDIASQWRAVLLLDEADVYMEKRTSGGDPSRTAMTAIFLRLMEYYRGVLFLTTNRVASFDEAFCSRISMFLRYHRLEGKQREAVWGNLFARAGVESPNLAPFLETRLNGREIRNTIRIAQTWARSSQDEVTTDHVLQVVNMLGGFRKDLEGAIRDEVDERFITHALANVHDGADAPLNGHFVKVSSVIDDEEAK